MRDPPQGASSNIVPSRSHAPSSRHADPRSETSPSAAPSALPGRALGLASCAAPCAVSRASTTRRSVSERMRSTCPRLGQVVEHLRDRRRRDAAPPPRARPPTARRARRARSSSSNCAWLISAPARCVSRPRRRLTARNTWRKARPSSVSSGAPREARRVGCRSRPSLDAASCASWRAASASASPPPGSVARAGARRAAARRTGSARARDPERPPVGVRERARRAGGRVGVGRARAAARPRAPPCRSRRRSAAARSAAASRRRAASGRSAAKAAVIAGMNEKPMPTPRSSSTSEIVDDRGVRADERERDRAEREHRDADDRDAPAAEALGQPAGDRHHDQHAEPLRPVEQAGDDHALAAHLLVVERHEDHRPEQRRAEAEGRQRGARRRRGWRTAARRAAGARRAARASRTRRPSSDPDDDRPAPRSAP